MILFLRLYYIMSTIRKSFFTFLLLIFLSPFFLRGESQSFRLVKNIDVFFSVLQELDLSYVDSINYDRMMKVAIDEMLNSLDPYTTYIPESELTDFDFSITGQYGGVGALIKKNGKKIEIAEPYQGSPADRAGLKAGDVIISVDDFDANNRDLSEISSSLKGRIGTSVNIKVLKIRTNDTVDLTITREQIHIPSVPYYGLIQNSSIGYISLSSFTKDCSKDVKNALLQLRKKGAKSIMLDLRDNTGGLLDEAVKVSNLFIGKGKVIVTMKGRRPGEEKIYKTKDRPVDVSIPVVVLVNAMSASSSEIVAGAFQDLDRGVIVGQKTFGKGLVQSERHLPFNGKLKLTTAKYYTPSGRCVQEVDYSHRTKRGVAIKTPDSLVQIFRTKNGRLVHDAGGITPDDTLKVETIPTVLIRLYEQNIISNYVNKFYSEHDTIPSISRFSFGKHYDDFLKYVNGAGFEYQTSSSLALGELINKLKRDKYYDSVEDQVKILTESLNKQRLNDLIFFQDKIVEFLEEEIITRYYYRGGRIAKSILKDEDVKRGVEILSDSTLYNSFLLPKD